MSQFGFIRDIAKFGLKNDQEKLWQSLNELVKYAKKTNKVNFAPQLQSILKEAIRTQQTSGILKMGSEKHLIREEDREVSEFILEKLTSDYTLNNLVCSSEVKDELSFFVKEHNSLDVLNRFSHRCRIKFCSTGLLDVVRRSPPMSWRGIFVKLWLSVTYELLSLPN